MSIWVVSTTRFVPKINRVKYAQCHKDGFHWYEHSAYAQFIQRQPSRIQSLLNQVISGLSSLIDWLPSIR